MVFYELTLGAVLYWKSSHKLPKYKRKDVDLTPERKSNKEFAAIKNIV